MTTTPEPQLVSERCRRLVMAIDDLASALDARIASDEWSPDHCAECESLDDDLAVLRRKVRVFGREHR